MKKKSIFLLVAAVFSLAACAKIVVTPLGSNQTTSSRGVIYALPKTVVRAQFKLEKISRRGARFVAYAPIFAPDGEPVCADSSCSAEGTVTWRLQDGVALSTYGEPDPDNVYLVEFSRGGVIDQTLSMTWNDTGLLTASSASVTNRAADVVMSSLKLVAGASAKGAFGAVDVATHPKDCGDRQSKVDEMFVGILRKKALLRADPLVENYCALEASARDQLPRDEKEFALAAQQYVDKVAGLTEARENILTAAQVFQAAEHIAALDTEISKVLTALFLGSASTKTWEGTLDSRWIRPTQGYAELLRIVPDAGYCIPTTAELPPDAKPFPKGMEPDAFVCGSGKPIFLKWAFQPAANDQLFSRITDDTKGDRSFRYVVPGRARFTVSDDATATGGHSFGAADLSISQLGKVVSLPAKRTSKQISYDLAFVEATGALKTFKLGTTGGLDAATIDSLSTATGTVLDAENARKQKRATEQDELTILTREATLLELRDKICTLRQKYGQSCADE